MASRDTVAARRRLGARRLAAQSISVPASDPLTATRRMLAVQGQDLPGALWSVGLRSGATRAAVERELADGGLVRSWPMRGTLHVLPRDDLGWLLELTGERAVASWAGRRRQLELVDDDLARAAAVARERLAGTALERRALLAAIEEAGVSTAGQRGANLLVWLAQTGVVLIRDGSRFALCDEHLPPSRGLDRASALAELARRYLAGHGPATVHDLAWWAGITVGDARASIGSVRDELDERVIDGTPYFLPLGSAAADAAEPASGVHALPGFDEYVLGYTDRAVALGDSPLERVVPGSNGMFLPTVVIDGAIAATWRRDTRGRRTRVELDAWQGIPVRRMPAVRRALQGWAEFSGQELELIEA